MNKLSDHELNVLRDFLLLPFVQSYRIAIDLKLVEPADKFLNDLDKRKLAFNRAIELGLLDELSTRVSVLVKQKPKKNMTHNIYKKDGVEVVESNHENLTGSYWSKDPYFQQYLIAYMSKGSLYLLVNCETGEVEWHGFWDDLLKELTENSWKQVNN